MSRNKLEALLRHIYFSGSPKSSDGDRSSYVSGLLDAINEHRQTFLHPSDTICFGESFSCWYGLGGDWIDIGLPYFVSLDSKPESGC